MKKILTLISALAVAFLLSSSDNLQAQNQNVVLKVAADAVPHAEILEFIKPQLAKEGIDLKIFITSEWTLINTQTSEGQYDANYFQHTLFLESASIGRKLNLVSIGAIHIEPIGLYSHKYKKLQDIPENPKIAVPNDPANEYRALVLLEKLGYITLKKNIKSYQASKRDIATYIKPIQLIEAEAGLIVRSGDQFDAYITNTNRILEFKVKDPVLAREEAKGSPYANIVAAKKSRANEPALQALVKALQSPEVKKFIDKKYKGAVVAAF
jgi:D-methionine transport system substrate-binding protein